MDSSSIILFFAYLFFIGYIVAFIYLYIKNSNEVDGCKNADNEHSNIEDITPIKIETDKFGWN